MDLATALAKVGGTPDALCGLLGSLLDGSDAYLVGSLAAGLGNGRSDIDVHIFDPTSGVTSTAPMVFFLDRTVVDVVYFEPSAPSTLVASLGDEWVPVAGGRCAVGTVLDPKLQVRIGRWSSALPLVSTSPPLVSGDALDRAVAANTRGACSDFIRAVALADLAEAAGRFGSVPTLWRRAARHLLEIIVRARGALFVGRRWVWAKAEKLDLDGALLDRIDAVRTSDDLRAVAASADVPIPDRFDLVTVVPAQHEPVELADRRLILLDGQRLVDHALAVSGPLGTAVAEVGADVCLAAVAYGAGHLEVDEAGVDSWLR